MMQAIDIINWLQTLPKHETGVYIDEGGLTLKAEGTDDYLEIGGEPRSFDYFHCDPDYSDGD